MLSNYIAWIIFGALSGWIISQILPTRSSRETTGNVLIGLMGAFLTGLVLQAVTDETLVAFNVAVLIVTILSSVILLATIRNVVRN